MAVPVYFLLLLVITAAGIAYLVIWGKGNGKFKELLAVLPDEKHPMKCLYPFGFQVLEMVHYNYSGRMDKKYIGYCKVFYGENNGQFYYCINLTQKISVSVFVGIVGVAVGLMADSLLLAGLAVLAGAGVGYYYHTLITDIVGEREQSIMMEFPDVVSKLALLVNAGMILKEAWGRVSTTGDSVLYQEMQNAVYEMQNGVSEFDAYINFAKRCSVPAVTKFASTLVQNLSKGNKELVEFLRSFANDSWNERKQAARRKGEQASSKLVLPICIMFLGIMLMIMIPIFSGISF